ncbi:unnamed protein product [Didymodactylos carnosus]|uniref:Uncharacterized protein n=1 Tax=Didymodactylos carnosus TaxID=1234261 RepID=A0A8S2E279_9BILA|nr:unnamed protein product [Didymodactylos carnosus]CAF3814291.1 unnamed protein product [Didymodactylos carnosus]
MLLAKRHNETIQRPTPVPVVSINPKTRAPPAPKPVRRRSDQTSPQQNVEDFVLILLDFDSNKMDYNVILNKLRSIVNYIQIFDQSDECVDYVKSVKNEKIFIIVSDMLAEQLIDRVHNEPQLDSIYVFCSDSTAIVEHELWTKQYGKVRNVYNDIDPLCKQMKRDTKVCSNDFMGHASFDPNINIARGGIFNNQEPSFMYLQLIKEILIDMEHMEENKQEFIEFCREQYKDNTYN